MKTLISLFPDGTVLPDKVANLLIRGLCLDSRRLSKGEVFFALCGTVLDGRAYIGQAIAAGAAAVIVPAERDEKKINLTWQSDCPVIEVDGLEKRVSAIAGRYYNAPSQHLNVVGITGTNGKTTCTALIAQMETLLGNCGASVGTLGYGLATDATLTETGMTTPDAIETQQILAVLLQRKATSVAMEVSSHSLVQGRITGVAIKVAIFTNLTRDHLDYHENMEAYAKAKRELLVLPGLKHAIINIDDTVGGAFYRDIRGPQLWSYSVENQGADIYARDVRFTERGIEAWIVSPWGEGILKSMLLGPFNLSNLLAVIAALCAQGANFEQVLLLLPALKPVAGRMEKMTTNSDVTVVVDYAHTPDALQQALRALQNHTAEKLWCVFGCGGDRDKGKRTLMGAIAEKFANKVIVTSDNPRNENSISITKGILAGFKEPALVAIEPDRATAIATAIIEASPGDCVLIAGKGHEDYQLVGDKRLVFCDREQARRAMIKRNSHD